jgi:histidine triad (HIT) family protein
MTVYDSSNVFAKILRGEIPCTKLLENDYALAFPDIRPLAPVHILVIPKGAYVSLADFAMQASAAELAGFWQAVGQVARDAGLVAGGYRLISNHGAHAHQDVPHCHVHILGGHALGAMLAPAIVKPSL